MSMADTTTRTSALGSLEAEQAEVVGMVAQFETAAGVVKAAHRLRKEGYEQIDIYSPYPIHGADDAVGAKPSMLPWIVLGGGLTGMVSGVVLCWYTNAAFPIEGLHPSFQSYPYLISGKPLFSLPANIPVIFELTILLSAFAAVLGMLGLNRLPHLYHPLFKSKAFRRVTQDGFFLAVEASDRKFDRQRTRELLQELESTGVEELRD